MTSNNKLYKLSSASSSTATEYEVTQTQSLIMGYLVEHHFASTTQLYQEIHLGLGKSRTRTQQDLERLRLLSLVKSFEIERRTIGRNELCWLLTPEGAATAGQEYATKYKRKPSLFRLKLRDMELELARTISFAGVEEAAWSLIKPTNHSPSHPLPASTPQYYKLVEAVDFFTAGQVWADLLQGRVKSDGQTVTHFRQAQHRYGVPRQVNDYVAYLTINSLHIPLVNKDDGLQGATVSNYRLLSVRELREWAATISEHYTHAGLPIGGTIAVLLILCPPKIGPKFWLAKLNDYARLAKYLPVYGVFEDRDAQKVGEQTLAKLAQDEKNKRLVSGYGAHFNTITMAEVYSLLENIAANNNNTNAVSTGIVSTIGYR